MNSYLQRGFTFCLQNQMAVGLNAIIYLLLMGLTYGAFHLAGIPDLTEIIRFDEPTQQTIEQILYRIDTLDRIPFIRFSGYTLGIFLMGSLGLVFTAGGTLGQVVSPRTGLQQFQQTGVEYFDPFLKIIGLTGFFLLIGVTLDGGLMLGLSWLLSVTIGQVNFGVFTVLWSLIFLANLVVYALLLLIFFMITMYALADYARQANTARKICRNILRFSLKNFAGILAITFCGIIIQFAPTVAAGVIFGVFDLFLPHSVVGAFESLTTAYISGFATVFWLVTPYYHLSEKSDATI